MKVMGVFGAIIAVAGLLFGIPATVMATNVIQQIGGMVAAVVGVLGLVVATLGFGFASVTDILNREAAIAANARLAEQTEAWKREHGRATAQ